MIDPGRGNVDPEYVEKELKMLDNTLNEAVEIYVLGGAVMAL